MRERRRFGPPELPLYPQLIDILWLLKKPSLLDVAGSLNW